MLCSLINRAIAVEEVINSQTQECTTKGEFVFWKEEKFQRRWLEVSEMQCIVYILGSEYNGIKIKIQSNVKKVIDYK